MIDFEFEQMQQNPEWRFVLSAYRSEHLRLKQENPEADSSWLDRVREVDGVNPNRLTRIHGKLIALGLLKFEIAGRTDGVRYQVSQAGVQMLNRLEASDIDDSLESTEYAKSA